MHDIKNITNVVMSYDDDLQMSYFHLAPRYLAVVIVNIQSIQCSKVN